MQLFFRLVALHFVAGLGFVAAFGTSPADAIGSMLSSLPGAFVFFAQRAWWIVLAFAAALALTDRQALLARLWPALGMLVACNAFFLVFTMVKTMLPHVVPFYADPFLADLDKALHLGIDPWRLTHAIADHVPIAFGDWMYMGLWLVPAMYLPLILVLFDSDPVRQRRFLILAFVGWAVLGNILALAGMSAGPIYYDRLFGGERFAELLTALDQNGVWDLPVKFTQDYLWEAYATANLRVGSGISAFPSVHVGIVTVWALYLWERARWTAPLGIALVAAFVFFSVHFGWHYAVDGYASILIIWGVWATLKRRQSSAIGRAGTI